MNVERFNRAIAIIRGIPDAQLELKLWQHPAGMTDEWLYKYVLRADEATCGTICCAGGWLCIQPEMQAQGLSLSAMGSPQYHDGKKEYRLFYALEKFFGITENESDSLFGRREGHEFEGEYEGMTDKQVWLKRAKELKMKYEDKKVGPRTQSE